MVHYEEREVYCKNILLSFQFLKIWSVLKFNSFFIKFNGMSLKYLLTDKTI